MATPTTELTERIAEGSDYLYAPADPLRYSDGTPVIEAHIDTFTMTVTNGSGTVIRNVASVLGSGGEISSEGMLTVPITSQDTAGVGHGPRQKRRLTFRLLTTAGVHLNWSVVFTIDNFLNVS